MKTSDDLMDEMDNLILSVVSGILCVICTVYLSVNCVDAACIFLSILVGTALANKVDSLNHIISAVLFILILILIGFPHLSWPCLFVCILAMYFDEKGNDFVDEKEEKGFNLTFVHKLLKYRYVAKITVLILSVLGLIHVFYPNLFFGIELYFEPVTIVYFYLFDLGYEFSNKLNNCLYNVF